MNTCRGITKKFKFCKKPTGGKLLCVHHKRQPMYFFIIAITGIFFSYLSGLIPKPPLPWEKAIYVSPSLAELHTGNWASKTPLSICNRNDKPMHSVWVKLGLLAEGVTAESLIITVPNKTTDLDMKVGDISFSADAYRINAVDSSKCEAVFIVLHTILPGGCREFIISGSTKKYSSAKVSVVSFSEIPKPIKEDAKKALFFVTPPEDIKLKSIDMIVSKKL